MLSILGGHKAAAHRSQATIWQRHASLRWLFLHQLYRRLLRPREGRLGLWRHELPQLTTLHRVNSLIDFARDPTQNHRLKSVDAGSMNSELIGTITRILAKAKPRIFIVEIDK